MNFWYNFAVCGVVHKELSCILTGALNSLIIPLFFCGATVFTSFTLHIFFPAFMQKAKRNQ